MSGCGPWCGRSLSRLSQRIPFDCAYTLLMFVVRFFRSGWCSVSSITSECSKLLLARLGNLNRPIERLKGMRASRIPIVLAVLAVALAGCGTSEPATSQPAPDPVADTIRPADGGVTNGRQVPDDFIDTLFTDALARSNSTDAMVRLAESVTWSDGSLGCPEEGLMYTQAEVEGYRVVIATPIGDLYYHTSAETYFVVCEG
jgi:hypothetical protein